MRSSTFLVSVAAALCLASTADAQTAGCTTGGAAGAIPTSGSGGGGVYPGTLPPFEMISTLNVASIPGGSTAVTEVRLNGLTHTWAGDVTFVLEDPSGQKIMLLDQQGGSCDFAGDYVIVAPQLTPMPFPACAGVSLPPSTFSQVYGAWPSGTNGINNTSLSAVAPALGTWTLYAYDWFAGDIGNLTSWDLCFGTPPPPPPPPPTPCTGPSQTTLFGSNNNGSPGGAVFFDVNVTNPAGITVSQFDINTGPTVGTNFTMTIYTIAGSYVGNENNIGAWTAQATGNGVTAALQTPSLVEFTDFNLPPGSHGFALVLSGANSHYYTNGTGANQSYSNADFTMTLGAAQNVAFSGTPFTPRVFNGTLRYNCSSGVPPVNYCTAKTTSNGCVPAIAFSGTPTASGNYVLSCSQVEANQLGVLFYGLNGPAATPFQGGFLCVAPPVIRLPFQNSGGGAICTGTYSQPMTAVISSLSLGQTVNSQFWFRDPGTTSGTGLSDANAAIVQ